jgi:hypothetical protein
MRPCDSRVAATGDNHCSRLDDQDHGSAPQTPQTGFAVISPHPNGKMRVRRKDHVRLLDFHLVIYSTRCKTPQIRQIGQQGAQFANTGQWVLGCKFDEDMSKNFSHMQVLLAKGYVE